MAILPKPKHDGFKVGPNKLDQNKISTLAAEGFEAEDISQRLKIKLESVQSFMPKPKAKPKSKVVTKPKREA
ncbi:MAG: hypothetical protein GY937_26135 [bacterium]|nr:hypothetical protein [Alteromonadales bacterium]MCP5060195.1 hypothetical protein [bacterium]